MDTGEHYSPNVIINTGNTYVVYEYCTNSNSEGQCIERLQVVPYDSLKVQNKNSVESYSNTAVFVLVIMLLVWIVKGIFRWIFPTRGKK